jgi:hypothetical protein
VGLNEVLVHFVCNMFGCTCSVVGGGCGIHASNDERGAVFGFIKNGWYLCLHLKAGGLCLWLNYGKANKWQ